MHKLILVAAVALVAATPAAAQRRSTIPDVTYRGDPYADRHYTPYSTPVLRRQREARATAKRIREDERREGYRPSEPRRSIQDRWRYRDMEDDE